MQGSVNGIPTMGFKLNTMVSNPSILVVGGSNADTTCLIKDLIQHFGDDIKKTIISQVTDYSTKYMNIKNAEHHSEYSGDIIHNILVEQEILITNPKSKPSVEDADSLVIIDHYLSNTDFGEKSLQQLLFNGRHLKIGYVCAISKVENVVQEMLNNFDYIFILHKDANDAKKIYNHYCGMFPSFNSFELFYREAMKKHGYMVICNDKTKSTLTEKVFWYGTMPNTVLAVNINNIVNNIVESDSDSETDIEYYAPTHKKQANLIPEFDSELDSDAELNEILDTDSEMDLKFKPKRSRKQSNSIFTPIEPELELKPSYKSKNKDINLTLNITIDKQHLDKNITLNLKF